MNRLIKFLFVAFLPLLFNEGANLDEFIALRKGDLASIQLNQYAYAAWQVSLLQFDVFLYSFYDQNDSIIVVELYGMKENADDAYRTIEHFRALIKNDFIPLFKNNYQIEIDINEEMKFVYRNRSEEGRREIYLWEKGKYRYPLK
ncbi:MAG: hypothetical protein N3A65_09680 [candidate division WOR-3 bacterium]|nr:hypothetical protein [candidate division WOR-3 bacterium]